MRWRAQADLAAALLMVAVAAVAALTMAPGPARALATLPALAVAPGYLAVQAAVPRQRPSGWMRHACAALGVGPALLGLCALATALLPAGFRPEAIIGMATATAIVMGGVAMARRWQAPPPPARTRTTDFVGCAERERPS